MKVSIIGAGELGATLARKLAETDRCREVILYDTEAELALGKSLDILQSAPIVRFRTKVLGTRSIEMLSDSDIIVLTDCFGDKTGSLDEPAASRCLQQIGRLKSQSVLVAAETFSVRLLELALSHAGYNPTRVIGSSPLAMASAIKFLIARHIGCSHRDIILPVLGLPPKDLVIPWSLVSVGGMPLDQRVPHSTIRTICDTIKTIWPLGSYLLASAAHALCQDILQNRGLIRPCFAFRQHEIKREGSFVIAPARIGRPGVISIQEISLDPVYRVALENVYKSGGVYGTRI